MINFLLHKCLSVSFTVLNQSSLGLCFYLNRGIFGELLFLNIEEEFSMQYVLCIFNLLIISIVLCAKIALGDKRGTKNRIQKERKTIKPFQKSHNEMSETKFVPLSLGF